MSSYLKYTTQPDDRWDLIAYKMYGDATLFASIIAANPQVPVYPRFPLGIEVLVPVITPPQNTAIVPPWIAAAQKTGQLSS
jgi:phage tail protein X